MLDVLNALKCENVRMMLTDSVSSVQIEDAGQPERGLCCHANETVMSLTRLLIRDFRNIETADLALSPGFNFLVGANGSGKTSVLEAIIRSATVGRFAVCRLVASFATSREAFVLHGRLQGEERETAIGLTKDKQGDSKVRIDGTDGHKVAELAHLMPMQLITPEGFTLLNGGP